MNAGKTTPRSKCPRRGGCSVNGSATSPRNAAASRRPGACRPNAGPTRSRCCARTRRAASRIRSHRTASAASPARTSRRSGTRAALIYLEDQYLWSLDATSALCDALRLNPELRCVIVIPRYPDPDGRFLGGASRFGRWRVERALAKAGGDRVAIFDLANDENVPIYVHAKVCVVDDVWMAVGSDNLNRRSWTHDSEICCGVIDLEGQLARGHAPAPRPRAPRRPRRARRCARGPGQVVRHASGLGSGARRLARAWRAGGPSTRSSPAPSSRPDLTSRATVPALPACLVARPRRAPPRPASRRALLKRRRGCPTRAPRSPPGRRTAGARPPKAIEHSANHAHPSARPPNTSENQCTSRSTREHATATPIATAPPKSTACARRPRPRPINSATAAQNAAAVARVTARERRAQKMGGRVQRRPGPVEDFLDAVGEKTLTDEDDGQEWQDPAAPPPAVLDDRHDDRGDDHDLGRPELRDHLQDVVRELSRMVVRPLRDVVVQCDDPRGAAHEHRKRAQEQVRRGS